MSALLLATLVACGGGTIAPLPLEVGISASRTTAVRGDSINFLVTAQGAGLVGVEAVYGDGMSDLFATAGARTARVSFRHAYGSAGTYTVEAVATEVSGATRSATLEVRVD